MIVLVLEPQPLPVPDTYHSHDIQHIHRTHRGCYGGGSMQAASGPPPRGAHVIALAPGGETYRNWRASAPPFPTDHLQRRREGPVPARTHRGARLAGRGARRDGLMRPAIRCSRRRGIRATRKTLDTRNNINAGPQAATRATPQPPRRAQSTKDNRGRGLFTASTKKHHVSMTWVTFSDPPPLQPLPFTHPCCTITVHTPSSEGLEYQPAQTRR